MKPLPDVEKLDRLYACRLTWRRLLQKRYRDGSLLSVRLPVTPANRRLLRALRAAEMVTWANIDSHAHDEKTP
jgi:hypothetical protein